MIKKTLLILTPILFLALIYFYPLTKLELASSPQGNDSNSGAGVYGGNMENKDIINNEQKSDNQIININPKTSQSDARVNKNMTLQKPSIQIDKNKNYTALLKTTVGDIEIALNAKEVPVTVNNFVYLAKNNFYNNTFFHRVIKDFMIQGGDPTGTGSGGPGYQFNDESFSGEYVRGTIAMANAGPNTNGSQFFIMHKDMSLQKNYVIFGKVVKGIDVVDKIAIAQVTPNSSGEMSQPVNPIIVNSVEIIEN